MANAIVSKSRKAGKRKAPGAAEYQAALHSTTALKRKLAGIVTDGVKRSKAQQTQAREDRAVISLYRSLARWERFALLVILQSLSYGHLNAEKTDRQSFAEFRRCMGVPMGRA